MRAAAILGPGNSQKHLAKFRNIGGADWMTGALDLPDQADVAVVFGGDGTIHRHLSTLVNLRTPLLVVPCGSGNDFARALQFRSVQDSLAAWGKFLDGGTNVRAIDLGVIREMGGEPPAPREHYFCCVAGIGLDAEITRRANDLPKWLRAHGGYALSAPREFLRFAPFPMKISSNGNPSAFLPTILTAVANAPTYGGGMKIAPQAKLDDGKLDFCLITDIDKLKLFCLFPTVYFGRHLSIPEVEYF